MTEHVFHGSKVALFIGDRLLIILRDDDPAIPYPDTWDFPGGGREGNETPFETVARETMEEVGLRLIESNVLWERKFDADFARGSLDPREIGAKVFFFVAHLPAAAANDIVFGDEGQGWKLIPRDALAGMQNIVPSYPRRLQQWIDETGGYL